MKGPAAGVPFLPFWLAGGRFQLRPVQQMQAGTSLASGFSLSRQRAGQGMLAVANSEYVCTYGRREFTVVDAMTGELLWRKTDVPLHTHLAETAFEVERARKEYGMPVVPWAKKQRLFDARVLAAHCVHVDEGEIRTLREAGAGIAHNPTSNLKLGSGVAPVVKMLEIGAAVGIGTDGTASNNEPKKFRNPSPKRDSGQPVPRRKR